jgi:hypothetical protein
VAAGVRGLDRGAGHVRRRGNAQRRLELRLAGHVARGLAVVSSFLLTALVWWAWPGSWPG